MDIQRKKSTVAWLSVISNTVLMLGKLAVGLLIGSVAVISEAIHSGVDLVAAGIALFAIHTAGKPADEDHPFGHGKVENISGTVEALLIFLAAAWIVFEAIHKLIDPSPLESAGWGAGVMLVSAVVNILVSNQLFKVGKETDSVALQADAWHLRTDVYTSAGVMVGLGIVWLGKWLLPQFDLSWVDPVSAIIVALLIVRAAWQLTREAARDLLDASLPVDEEAWIRDYVARLSPTVRGFHHLRTRKAGAHRFIEFHLIVERALSVADSHQISEVIECDIEERYPGASILVHIEPCDGRCPQHCLEGCLLDPKEREQIICDEGQG